MTTYAGPDPQLRRGTLPMMGDVVVRHIDPASTHDLRLRILRTGVPDPRVDIPEDHEPDAVHLGAFEGGRLVGVMSLYIEPTPHRPGRRAAQLRFMAVDADRQGHGVGNGLMEAAMTTMRAAGVEAVWANARDTALEFYLRRGFMSIGNSFIHEESGLPHTLVILDLDRDQSKD